MPFKRGSSTHKNLTKNDQRLFYCDELPSSLSENPRPEEK